jgi:hypothetical protein
VRKEITGAFPKIAMRSFEPEELRQLRAGYKQRDTAFESDEHTFRNEVYDHPRLCDPRDETQAADNQRRARRQSPKSEGIASSQIAERCSHEN